MLEEKEAVIFIPGFVCPERNYYLERFLAVGLTTRIEDEEIILEPEEVKISGQSGRRFVLDIGSEKPRIIDVYEVYWADLINGLSNKDIKTQFLRGLYLIYFWFVNGWKVAKISRIFFTQIGVILFLLAAWYYSIIVMALTAVGTDPNVFGFQIPDQAAEALGLFGKNLGGWSVWLGLSAVLSFLPITLNLGVDMADFVVRYAQDDIDKEMGGLREKVRYRLKTTVNDVVREEAYSKITILSHSLGTLIATDFMADYHPRKEAKIRFITWGGALESISAMSTWLTDEIYQCCNNPDIERWDDYYSDQDWLCSRAPIPSDKDYANISSSKIPFRVSLAKQFSGESHLAYFFDETVLKRLIRR
ncbi:hypothetical protein ACQ4N7_23350 [Nodosilinea sp. AN01ver1]|uniref:hypothetical protein n=1 Tax=Nodosilinea sp. AN01ver1 TaxID=3423362 RepID=UPI003D311C89